MTKKEILTKITEQQIYQYYFGIDVQANKSYRNTIAGGDSKTLKFFLNKEGELIFKDFSPNRANFRGDIINCVMLTRNLNREEATTKLMEDMNLGFTIKKMNIVKRTIYNKPKPPSNIKVIIQEFQDYDLDYWKSFNINLDLLKIHQVYSIKQAFLNDELWLTSTKHRPVFGYKHKNLWKIYCPLRKDFKKWCGNWNRNCIGGLDGLDYSKNHIIITSSIKDGLVLSSHGFNQISIPSENTIPEGLGELLKKFKNKYVFLDFDLAGHTWSKVIAEQFDIIPIIYNHKEVKDIADFSKKYGYNETEIMLQQIFYYYEEQHQQSISQG